MSENSNYNDSGAEFEDDLSPGNNDKSNRLDDSWLNIEVNVRANQVDLLQGFEAWLRLGLLSQGQIKKIARQRLSCALPSPEVPEPVTMPPVSTAAPTLVAATPNALQEIWHSFLDELSIRWLLFLGIFLVVVSSAVLAASQWQNFPNYGQYIVLLTYTLSFWGIGFWTGKQNSLRLTSQTLKAIATLLIPINFWTINHLGLGNKPLEWGIIAAAAISLLGSSYLSLQSNKKVFALGMLFWLLSLLHLCWQLPFLPLITVYSSMVAICCIERQLLRRQRRYPLLTLFFALAAWLLWLTRLVITATDSFPQCSLAIAIFAWLVCDIYLGQGRRRKVIALKRKSAAILNALVGKIAKLCCITLFCLSWLVSLNAGLQESSLYIYQTVGISFLAINLFSQRLNLYWQKRDLTTIFLIGLQTLYICKELIPDSWRSQALNTAVVISKTEYFPESVFGVTLFPYIILWVLIASWLYDQGKRSLGLYSEWLTLFLGIVLTCLSFSNPTWRSLNLGLSTLTLGYVGFIRHPVRSSLVYLTHLLGLITIINGINLVFADLNQLAWGCITLALMTVEWTIYLTQINQRSGQILTLINRSCWYFGLLLSAVSYVLLLEARASYWGLIWLAAPVMLTLIGKYSRQIQQRRLATVISCIALISVQLLVFEPVPARLVALLVATGLMMLNAFNLRRLPVALIHLGLAIALVSNILDLLIPHPANYYGHWLVIGALVILLLHRLRLYLRKTIDTPKFGYISQRNAFGILGVGRETRNFKLVGKYLLATDYWGIGIMAVEVLAIAITYLFLSQLSIDQYFWHFLLTTGLLIGSMWWRYRAKPNNLVLYTLTGLIGVSSAGIVRLLWGDTIALATVNILLGLVALVIIALVAQGNSPWSKLNLALVPITYAALGIWWRISDFNAYTGLLTLGAAFIFINTQPQNQLLDRLTKYLGFAGISWGTYELVIYQMQRGSGGSAADALTILSLVAAAIAFSYRLGAYIISSQGKSNRLFNLSLNQVILIAHLHWAVSSILKIIAAGIAIETNTSRLSLVSIATSLCLGMYALIQAREGNNNQTENKKNHDWWVYVGLVEIAATLVYSRLIISRLSLFDPWRIVFTCAVALLIYQIPWQNFGWRSTPWQRAALVTPVLMALVTAEDISYFNLLLVGVFYLRIAYSQRNIRWSYVSLGLFNWLAIRLAISTNFGLMAIASIVGVSLLYIAQLEPYLQQQRQQRHYLRLLGSSLICTVALWEYPGWIPGAIAFGFIFLGLGLRIRAVLFTGTITLVITVLHQLIILIFTYSYLKWLVGLLAGIGSIAIAAGFENKREQVSDKLKTYQDKLQNWQ